MKEIEVIIGLEIDGTKIALSENAARELYNKLAQFFGPKEINYPIVYPYINPSYPWILSGTIIPENDITVTYTTGATLPCN